MFKVKQAAELLNTSVSTLHYYEKRNLISPRRGENGYRYYSHEDILLMRLILLMRHYHFSVDEIKLIIRNFTNDEDCEEAATASHIFFSQKIAELQSIIQGYQDLITLIQSLPLMNDFVEFDDKKDKTVSLINQLYEKLN